MTIKEVAYGVFEVEGKFPSYFMDNKIHKCHVGFTNGVIISQKKAEYLGNYFKKPSMKWVHREVWKALPRPEPIKLKDKLKDKIKSPKSIQVKLFNCKLQININ